MHTLQKGWKSSSFLIAIAAYIPLLLDVLMSLAKAAPETSRFSQLGLIVIPAAYQLYRQSVVKSSINANAQVEVAKEMSTISPQMQELIKNMVVSLAAEKLFPQTTVPAPSQAASTPAAAPVAAPDEAMVDAAMEAYDNGTVWQAPEDITPATAAAIKQRIARKEAKKNAPVATSSHFMDFQSPPEVANAEAADAQ
jgi:hypothetical protein